MVNIKDTSTTDKIPYYKPTLFLGNNDFSKWKGKGDPGVKDKRECFLQSQADKLPEDVCSRSCMF